MVAGVVSSVWLGTYSIPWLADTRALVQRLLVLALAPAPYPEVGSPNPGTGRLIQGANQLNQPMGRIQTLDQHAPNHHPAIRQHHQRSVHATARARAIGIVPEIPLLNDPLTHSDAIDEVVAIARGKGTGIETARGGTPIDGILRTWINHRLPGCEVTSTLFLFGPKYVPTRFLCVLAVRVRPLVQ